MENHSQSKGRVKIKYEKPTEWLKKKIKLWKIQGQIQCKTNVLNKRVQIRNATGMPTMASKKQEFQGRMKKQKQLMENTGKG